MHYTLALVFVASALAAPLDHEASKSASESPSSTFSTEPPNSSASGGSVSPASVAPSQRLACDDPTKWPNGGISLLADAMNILKQLFEVEKFGCHALSIRPFYWSCLEFLSDSFPEQCDVWFPSRCRTPCLGLRGAGRAMRSSQTQTVYLGSSQGRHQDRGC
ncbi:hypothetical protein B0H16DRAFT_305243 [Mycena metata]|uniref:Uncharacterized protein n=1 Tax=Mycena metata TaxID=1033252 RepID=A0AAD7KFQ5_9AGAR|nr:hypothetical protein B0H16DRAFT_305243 [Mycena metata]